MPRALSAVLFLLSASLSTATFTAGAQNAPKQGDPAQIRAAYAQVLQELPPDLQGWELDPDSRAALRRRWELLGRYLVSRGAAEAPATAAAYAAMVSALDPTLRTQVEMLDAHTAVLALTTSDIGHLMIVHLSSPAVPTVWHVDEAAQGANGEKLACWTTAERSCAGSVTVLPDDAQGSPRFFVDAGIAQAAGATRGRQLSVWRWDGHEAVPIFLQPYAIGGDAEDNGARLAGDRIRIGEKGNWDSFFACGGCDGRHVIQTLRITAQGVVDQGAVSRTPELDALDEIYSRIRDDRSAEELASPGALQTLRESWAPMTDREHPSFFLNEDEAVSRSEGRIQLCFRAEYITVPMVPILFTFEHRDSRLYIVDAQQGSQNCSMSSYEIHWQASRHAAALQLAAQQGVVDTAQAQTQVRQFVAGVMAGAPDFARIVPEEAQTLRSRLPAIKSLLTSVGAVRAVVFEGVTPGGPLIYHVTFERGPVSWRILLRMDGKIFTASLEPAQVRSLALAQPVPLPPGAASNVPGAGSPVLPNMSCGPQYSPQWDNCVGSLMYPNGNVYQGEFHHGLREGFGFIVINATGVSDHNNILSKEPSIYAGPFRDGRLNGHGVWFTQGGAGYSGTFIDNIPQSDVSQKNCSGPPPSWDNCVAAVRYGNGNLYRGEFIHGQRDGVGMLLIAAAGSSDAQSIRMPVVPAVYVGEFRGDRLNGKGMVFMPGAGFYGTFTDNIFQRSISTVTAAHPGEYGHYDVAKVFNVVTSGGGGSVTINFSYLDQIIDDLASHAAGYPPKFDSTADLDRAKGNVKALSEMLGTLATGPSANAQLLLRTGELNSIGHNLDVPGTADRAVAAFTALLRQSPDDARANYLYGKFLADAGKPADAIPPLEKAKSLGVANADYTLGIAYLMTGDRGKALENLEAYAKAAPDDTNAARMIDAIRSGNVQFKKVN